MSVMKPRSLFAVEDDRVIVEDDSVIVEDDSVIVEDDGLIRRLTFCASDDLISFDFSLTPPSLAKSTDSSGVLMEPNSSSQSEHERSNSSVDSITNSDVHNRHTLSERIYTRVDTTPPYRKVRALRLFGSPQSPKTLLKQSELNNSDVKKRTPSNVTPFVSTPKPQQYDNNHNSLMRGRPLFSDYKYPYSPHTNINPFFKTEVSPLSQGKRRRDSGICRTFNDSRDIDDEPDLQPSKRLHYLKEGCLSRYETEFLEVCQIGYGAFGSVFKCINRLDGVVYAIKKSKKPVSRGTSDDKTALMEVYAHAVLGHHKHVVRYYSAWAENDRMLIQNEYCNGGSLADAIEKKKREKSGFSESEVKHILLHVALGLRYIHSLNLAHMDIKPGNIFISKKRPVSRNSSDDGFEDDDQAHEDLIYKIGDLGHVTKLQNPEVEEGDCRYMPPELLDDDYKDLPKSDIFALGLTIFEVCAVQPLPQNGDEWQLIRKGILPSIPSYSKELNALIKEMIDPDPAARPTSAALVQNQTLVPYLCKTKEQLHKELSAEKFKNQLLSRELKKAEQSLSERNLKNSRLSRLVGGKTNRSHSVTNF